MLKAQDVIVALRLVSEEAPGTYASLGQKLGISPSEIHACVRRLQEARLVDPDSLHVRRTALLEFLIHGVPYAFPARLKEVTRGIPTAWAAPAFAEQFAANDQLPPVWPHSDGTVQGAAVQPLYPSVPRIVQKDPGLYELLALVDALRIGRARERSLAQAELTKRVNAHA